MRKLILFLALAAAIGGAAIWHFSRPAASEEPLSAVSLDPKEWDPEVLRDTLAEIVVGGGPPPAKPEPAPPQAASPDLMKTASPQTTRPADPPPPKAGEEKYTIQPGDTLGAIAKKKYGSSAPRYVDAIVKKNSLKNPDALKVGTVLTLPDPATFQKAR